MKSLPITRTPTWPGDSIAVNATAFNYQPPLTEAAPPSPASTEVIVSSSHTYTFRGYSQTKRLGIGVYLASDTFMAGGYKWAIALYPGGKKHQDIEYISLYIRFESEQTDVSALLELVLVDQSGKGTHKIQTQFGKEFEKRSCLMRHRGSQWGFSRFIKKKYLEESDYLKDDCLVVNCKVGVHKGSEIPISRISSLPRADQITHFMEEQNVEDSDFKDTKLSQLRSASKIILETGSQLQLTEELIFDGDRDKIDLYLHAVDEIQQSITSGMISAYECDGINVIQMAMKTLRSVFQGILDSSINMVKNDSLSSTTSSSVTNSYSYELHEGDHFGHGELSSEQVNHLRSITERLNLAGSLGYCIEVYKISRKSVVDARFQRFGIRKWSINDFRSSDWEESAANIKLWIQAAHICYRTIFPWEKQYYEHIFDGFGAATYDNCFLHIVKHVAVELSNFAEAVTSTPASFQKLFDILDLYNTLLVIVPEIKAIFHTENSHLMKWSIVRFRRRNKSSAADIYLEAAKTVDRLGNLVRQILSNFKDAVLNEQLNTPLSRGIIHSLTRYAMDYITRILTCKELLAKIIISEPIKIKGISEDDQFLEVGGRNPLRLHLIWIIISLKSNLEVKSRHYEDASLGKLFLMNNVHYIVEKIKGSWELHKMIGEDYSTKLSEYILQAAKTYVGSTWDRALNCLRDEGLNHKFPFYNGISKNALKERFKSFNSTLEEICRTQSTWLVPDSQLRGQLHRLILEKLIPAYESFRLQFRSHIESEKHPEKYIKYSSDDLENLVHNLFLEH